MLPHCIRDLISSRVGSERLIPRHRTCSEFTHGLQKRFFIIAYLDLANLLRVVFAYEVVQRCKRRRNEGLNTDVILRRKLEDSKTTLEDPKDPLDDIASGRVTQIE